MEKWWGTWERRRNGASSARKQARDERAAVREEVGINVHGWIGRGGADRQKWGTRKKGTRERGSRPSFAVLAYDAPAAGGSIVRVVTMVEQNLNRRIELYSKLRRLPVALFPPRINPTETRSLFVRPA